MYPQQWKFRVGKWTMKWTTLFLPGLMGTKNNLPSSIWGLWGGGGLIQEGRQALSEKPATSLGFTQKECQPEACLYAHASCIVASLCHHPPVKGGKVGRLFSPPKGLRLAPRRIFTQHAVKPEHDPNPKPVFLSAVGPVDLAVSWRQAGCCQ